MRLRRWWLWRHAHALAWAADACAQRLGDWHDLGIAWICCTDRGRNASAKGSGGALGRPIQGVAISEGDDEVSKSPGVSEEAKAEALALLNELHKQKLQAEMRVVRDAYAED